MSATPAGIEKPASSIVQAATEMKLLPAQSLISTDVDRVYALLSHCFVYVSMQHGGDDTALTSAQDTFVLIVSAFPKTLETLDDSYHLQIVPC